MLDYKYVEQFSFHNFVYMALGAAVFVGPWLLLDSLWEKAGLIPTGNIVVGLLMGVIFYYIYCFALMEEKYKKNYSLVFKAASRRFFYVLISALLINIAVLTLYGRISLVSTAGEFGKALLATQVAVSIAGIFTDLLMSK